MEIDPRFGLPNEAGIFKEIAKGEQKINISTALRLIDDFIKLKILVEITGQKRNRIFAFEPYIKLFR